MAVANGEHARRIAPSGIIAAQTWLGPRRVEGVYELAQGLDMALDWIWLT
jgi:hypothetical protein